MPTVIGDAAACLVEGFGAVILGSDRVDSNASVLGVGCAGFVTGGWLVNLGALAATRPAS